MNKDMLFTLTDNKITNKFNGGGGSTGINFARMEVVDALCCQCAEKKSFLDMPHG